MRTTTKNRGELVAHVLNGAWRSSPTLFVLSEAQLEAITPILLNSGAAGLAWWRIQHSQLKGTSAASQLRQAYLFHALECAVRERELQRAVNLLRRGSMEPMLAKGWALSRLYPEKGLRPYGDIDLCVRPEQYEKASQLLAAPDSQVYMVDLHRGFADLDDRSLDELYRRSQLVCLTTTSRGRTGMEGHPHPLPSKERVYTPPSPGGRELEGGGSLPSLIKGEGVKVRILGPEDHLRFVCLHLLRHGAWAPIWLSDVSLLVETLPSGFDWHYFLSGDKLRTQWVKCALVMSHKLLDSNIAALPTTIREKPLPRWLIPAVLRQWGKPSPSSIPIYMYLQRPHQILSALKERWPNPVEATVALKAPFNNMPCLPLQLLHVSKRAATFPFRAMRMLGGSLKRRVRYVRVSMKVGAGLRPAPTKGFYFHGRSGSKGHERKTLV